MSSFGEPFDDWLIGINGLSRPCGIIAMFASNKYIPDGAVIMVMVGLMESGTGSFLLLPAEYWAISRAC